MKPESGHQAYRPDIDGLRALAILSVLGFHAFPYWLPGGFIGVDIFFVISGYLISGILLSDLKANRFSLAGFYARRIRRIFPALILVLAATLAAGLFILWPDELARLGEHAAGGAGFIVNILLGNEAGYFDIQAETKPLLHLWSLGVEEQFYILWPLLLWTGWRSRKHTGVAILSVFAASFLLNLWLAAVYPVQDFYSIFPRFWELLAGGALAWATHHKLLRSISGTKAEILSLIGMGSILGADFLFNSKMPFPGWAALLPVTGACCLIAGGQTFLNRLCLGNRAAVWIGLISYPLYLWHWPLLSFAHIVAGETPPRLWRIGAVLLSVILAAATFYLIEKPTRARKISRKLIATLVALMIFAGGSGLVAYASGGLPQRYADGGLAAQKLDSNALIAAWQKQVRKDDCYIQEPGSAAHAPSCVEKTHPLLLLWGDSHAAALYPGLKALQEKHPFGIAQLTQGGCPPILSIPKPVFRPDCDALNADILRQATAMKPDVILLAAAWQHDDYPMTGDDMLQRLSTSVDEIKKTLPKARLIVVGPAPHWLSPLPAIYRRALTFQGAPPPMRLAAHLDPSLTELDTLMHERMAIEKIPYLSVQQQLCDADGCLTRLGDDLDTITFVDDGHVSQGASERVVNAFAPTLLSALGLKP